MSLPTTKSKFKGVCKKCKVEYATGAEIYKINEEYWCSNPKCPGVEPQSTSQKEFSPIDLEAKLDQLWDICHAKAVKIIDQTYTKQELVDGFGRKKQCLIMAQTFIKALCGND